MICKRELDIWNLQGYKKRAGEVGQIGQLLKDCLNDHFQYNKRQSQSQALLLFHGVTKSKQKNRDYTACFYGCIPANGQARKDHQTHSK